jgi:hypothetical protein
VPARLDARQRSLFAPESLAVTPSPEARLRALAAAPRRPPVRPGTRTAEDAEALEKLRAMAEKLAAQFRLRYTSVDAEAEGVVEHYGICYADGCIRIRLRHAKTARLLKESSLVDTLCHELAHLKHFDHSPRFRSFYEKILAEARHRGWYRPGPVVASARQAPLWEISR